MSGRQLRDTVFALSLRGALPISGESVAGGPYAVGQGTLTANSNYTISFSGSTLSITPASLTVKADSNPGSPAQVSFTKVYSAADPTLNYTVSGVLFGDIGLGVLD